MHDLPLTIVIEKEVHIQAKRVLIWNAKDAFNTDILYPFPVHWIFDSESLCIPIYEKKQEQIHVLEMFSGGFGGWSYAQRFLKQHLQIPMRVVSIEENFDAAKNHSFNHDTILVDVEGPHEQLLQQTDFDLTLHGDIRSQHWWESISKWGIDGFTISAPCGPWSGASFSPGLQSHAGMLFPESIILARVFRPKWILMENVVGFKNHKHMKFCTAILQACNYRLVWSNDIDAAQFGASHRQRWLGLAVSNSSCKDVQNSFSLWPSNQQLTPDIIGAIFQNPPDASELALKQIMHSFAHEWILLPPQDKPGLREATGQAIFRSRCYTKYQQHPTFMAQYGSQHEMSRNQMELKGYYAHFYQSDDGTTRLLHPCEIAMIHLHWNFILIPHDFKEGWRHIGNMITIPHALLMLANVYKICYDLPLPGIEEIFHAFFDARLNQSNLRQFSGKHATVFIDHSNDAPKIGWDRMVDNFDILTEQPCNERLGQNVWKSVYGRVDISELLQYYSNEIPSQVTQHEMMEDLSPTQTFVPMMKAQIVAGEETGNVWVAADIEKEVLQETFDGHFQPQWTSDDLLGSYLKMVPQTIIDITNHTIQKTATPCLCESSLTFVGTEKDQTILSRLVNAGFNDRLFDQFGPIDPTAKLFHGILVSDFPFETDQKINPLFLIAAWKQTETSFIWNAVNLTWNCSIQGDFTACLTVEFFWFTLLQKVKNNLGIIAEINQNGVGRHILFKMDEKEDPTTT